MKTDNFETCAYEGCERVSAFKNTGLCQSHQIQHRKGESLRPLRRFMTYGEAVICGHDGCSAKARTLGFCVSHYLKYLRTGTTYGPGSGDSCDYPDCDNPVSARGLCERHYTAPQTRTLPCHITGCTRTGLYGFCSLHSTRARRFGLTPRELKSIIDRGKCDACGTPGYDHAIHHDHSCCDKPGRSCGGCVVAYLCRPCNSAAGLVGDNPEILLAIAGILTNNKPAFPDKERTGRWKN